MSLNHSQRVRMELRYQGRAWKFGHDLAVDGDVMELRHVMSNTYDPVQLAPHVLERIDPDFAKNCRPGDLIVAGRNFARGNAHAQGFYGMLGLGVGLVVESIFRCQYRDLISVGLPFLPSCLGITDLVETGDQLDVDFRSGTITNLTRGTLHQFPPLPAQLIEIIEAGGTTRWMGQKLRAG